MPCVGAASCPTCQLMGSGNKVSFSFGQLILSGNCKFPVVAACCIVNCKNPHFHTFTVTKFPIGIIRTNINEVLIISKVVDVEEKALSRALDVRSKILDHCKAVTRAITIVILYPMVFPAPNQSKLMTIYQKNCLDVSCLHGLKFFRLNTKNIIECQK